MATKRHNPYIPFKSIQVQHFEKTQHTTQQQHEAIPYMFASKFGAHMNNMLFKPK